MPEPTASLSREEAVKIRLANLFQKYLDATISQAGIKELVAAKYPGIRQEDIEAAESAQQFPTYAKSLDKLGKHIEERFKSHDIGKVTRQRIFSWKRSARQAGHAPFPKCKANGDYNVSDCLEWVRTAVLPALQDSAHSPVGGDRENKDYLSLIRQEDYAERVFARQLREGMHMKRAEHDRIVGGLGMLMSGDLWERFDTTAYERFADAADKLAMPEEWRNAALTILRELNPRLLKEHHAWVQSKVEEVRKETDES